ncbi:hypothetical protein BAUCODRAFT_45148, partial [Baudoinia panamericana UAMH 10762]
MSAATGKKPATPAGSGRPSANPTPTTVTPSCSPSSMAAQVSTPPLSNGGGAAAAAAVTRMRSVKHGAPVSARTAATARKQQSSDSDATVDDVRAEMQAKLDELHDRLQQAEVVHVDSQKQAAFLQRRLNETLKDQAMLEEAAHEHVERIEELEHERKEGLRARREMEQIFEAERAATIKEREEAAVREEDLQISLQRMKEALAQRELRAGLEDGGRPSMSRNSSFRRSENSSPNPDGGNGTGQFAPPASLQRSDSRSSSRLVMHKDKIIESLRLELAEAQIKLVDVENLGGGALQQLQRDLYDAKIQNARLMEENESFQLLLSEKTLNGDLAAHSDLLRLPSHTGSSRPGSSNNRVANSGSGMMTKSGDGVLTKRLQAEIQSLKDQNKALTVYINNIISRLLQHENLAEQILSKAQEEAGGRPAGVAEQTPPPPSVAAVEQQAPQGFLQRARSVMGGGGRGRPRPVTQMQQQQQQQKANANENPDTAPRIPLGRSSSTRTSESGSRHRRANS